MCLTLATLLAGDAMVFAQRTLFRSDTTAYYRTTLRSPYVGGAGEAASYSYIDRDERGYSLSYAAAAEYVYLDAQQSFEGTCLIVCYTGGGAGYWDTVAITDPSLPVGAPISVQVTAYLAGVSEAQVIDPRRLNFAAAGLRSADAVPPGEVDCTRPFSEGCSAYELGSNDAVVTQPEGRGEFFVYDSSPLRQLIANGGRLALFVWGMRTWHGDSLRPGDVLASAVVAGAVIESDRGEPLEIRSAARGELD
jgi:hypothetical protein